MQLTKNFKLEEFKCNDEEKTQVPEEYIQNVKLLAEQLQIIRDKIAKPIIILSGYRTEEWNYKIQGAPQSTHKEGKAADIYIKGYASGLLYTEILNLINKKKIINGGLKRYPTWIHYDIGRTRRW